MKEQVAAAIFETVSAHGHAVLAAPDTFHSLLVRRGDLPVREVSAITAALEHGTVTGLAGPRADRAELGHVLARRAGLPAGLARWSVETWAAALAAVQAGVAPVVPDWRGFRDADRVAVESSPFRRSLAAFIVVVAFGVAAGALPGLLIAAGVKREVPQALSARQAFARHEPPGQRLAPSALAQWAGWLGALGGLIGAGLGWTAGGFGDASAKRVFRAVCGVTLAFDGAAFGLAAGGLTGVLFGALAAATAGVMLAAALGRFAWVLLFKPAAWLFVPHF